MTRAGSTQTSAFRDERGCLGVPVAAAEAEQGGWSAERPGEEGERRDADAAADEKRTSDLEVEAAAERAEHVQLLARPGHRRGACRARSGRSRGELACVRQADAHRPQRHRPGASSMKNWPGTPASRPPGRPGGACTARSPRRR